MIIMNDWKVRGNFVRVVAFLGYFGYTCLKWPGRLYGPREISFVEAVKIGKESFIII